MKTHYKQKKARINNILFFVLSFFNLQNMINKVHKAAYSKTIWNHV